MNDFRYAIRSLARQPGFTAAAVLTLALGIGATTSMFSVVRGVLLEPLPYERPDQLVSLWTRYLPQSGQDIPQFPLSPPEMIDYREQTRLMQDVVPYGMLDRTLGGDADAPQRVRTGFLGEGMFELLGVRAAIGRTFAPEEEEPDAAPVVVLSHGLWQDRFGGDTSIVGGTVLLNGEATRVVGVMPDAFVFPDASVELWAPFGLNEATATNRFAHYLLALGRLRTGATLEQAQQEMETITAAWNTEHEHHAMGHFIFLRGFHDDLVGDRGRALWLLMAAVGLLLVIAAANVANLLLARMESRHTEIAVRAAIGASRARIAKQLLVESFVLAGAGAALGVLLAAWATPALLAVYPEAIPRTQAVRLDGTVLGFALITGVATALLFGLVPALRRQTPAAALATTRATGGRAPVRLRSALVGAEAALGVLVILAAGLVTRTFVQLTKVETGVRNEGLLLFDLQLPAADYPGDAVPQAYASLLDRLRALPGVREVGATTSVPIVDIPVRQDMLIEGEPAPRSDQAASSAHLISVHPGYFEALGIPLRDGRGFHHSDREGSLLVAVVNEAAARAYWAGDAVGKRFRYPGDAQPWITVAGVVGNTKVESLREADRPQVFLPHRQLRTAQGSIGRSFTVVVRTDLDPVELAQPVRGVVREVDSRLSVANLRTMDGVLSTALAPERFTASLLGGFAVAALVLAAIGVYGVTAYAVTSRTREIGIRMALGARAVRVLLKVMSESVQPVVVGAACGLAVGLAGAGVVSRLVFGVGVRDPVTFIGAPILLLLVAAGATYLPARRASRVDPMEALRYE
jgi:putative ABC transport system permease protein